MKYTIHEILKNGTEQLADHPYIFTREGNDFTYRTYGRFASDVRRVAAFLNDSGMNGKKFILYGSNSYEYMAADAAVMAYTGVSCTVSKEWTAENLIRAAGHIEADAVIYSDDRRSIVSELHDAFPEMFCISFSELMDNASVCGEYSVPEPADRCCKIIFSSGTTGVPKAVMLSQEQMYANYDDLVRRTPFTADDAVYLFLPLSHTYSGICNFLYSLVTGMQIWLCSDTKLISEELQMVRPTVFCTVPLVLERFYSACQSGGVPAAAVFGGRLKYLFCGGAFCRPELREFFKKSGINLLEAYGLTETSSVISVEYTDPDDCTSAGTVMENIDIRIDSPDENGVGEILVRGRNLSSGYLKNTEATAAAFDSDGFFHTGDLGFLQGRKLYLKGRKRRMILFSNGENVYPDEIEKLFMEYDDIQHAKVYQKDRIIFAELFVKAPRDCEDIVNEVNSRVPDYAEIRGYEVICDSINRRLK